MGFSPLANMSRRIPDVGRSTPRYSSVVGIMWHYQYGLNAHGEATNPNREVSANYWITNEGDILPNIDETRRAWTTGADGYPAGADADHRFITVEVSCTGPGTDQISIAALSALVKLTADVFKRYGLGQVLRGTARGVSVHRDFVPTSCPGNFLMGQTTPLINEAEKIRVSGGTPAVTGGSSSSVASGDTHALAQAVIRGEYGNGAERQAALGSRYNEVQAEVNHILGIGGATASKPASVDIESLAKAVLRGEYGNGEERMRRLGNNYAAVQARVNQLLGIQPSTPAVSSGVDINALAHAVIRGDYGNGEARVQKLGSLYNQVQAEVNRILGY